jgi:hypothetical protein
MRRFLIYAAALLSLGAKGYSEEPETFEKGEPVQRSFGLTLEPGWSKNVRFRSALTAGDLPRRFDWRDQAQLTPPKQQGSCGSCWAFSHVGVLESAIAIKDKKLVDLSEQYMLSCNPYGWGCNGGYFNHQMHINPGAVPESEFPYAGQKLACKNNLSHPYRLDSWAFLPSSSESEPPSINEIKAAIYQYGPIAAALGANDSFSRYRSGVFNACDGTQPNHAIVLIGWDDDQQSWILRNSWGTEWGQNGVGYIRYGCNKIGISANYVMFTGSAPAPGPGPAPKPTPEPLPKCSPMPFANAGPNYRVMPGQTILLGTRGLPGTAYMWEINGQRNPNYNTPQIKARVFGDAIFTVYATTKCGTARSSAMVTVFRRR